ncbi:hypothetical protein BDF19DRAFT_431578 [Syncephalis fuscata]|nr:hypothetical protein BDF19DRAFT_431578 [Syncephalis fuscata]
MSLSQQQIKSDNLTVDRQNACTNEDFLFEVELPSEAPPCYSTYPKGRMSSLSFLSTFARRGSVDVNRNIYRPAWSYLRSSLHQTHLLYLEKRINEQDSANNLKNSNENVNMLQAHQFLHSSCPVPAVNDPDIQNNVSRDNHVLVQQLADTQLHFLRKLNFTQSHYVDQLMGQSTSTRSNTRNILQLFALRNDTTTSDKCVDICYNASAASLDIFQQYFETITPFTDLYKSCLEILKSVCPPNPWSPTIFTELLPVFQQMKIYSELAEAHSNSIIAFENLYSTDKKLRKAIKQLENKAPAACQQLRHLPFVAAVEHLWHIGSVLRSIYKNNTQSSESEVNSMVKPCLDVLEKTAMDLWPRLCKLAAHQQIALIQSNISCLKAPLLSLEHQLLYVSPICYQIPLFNNQWIHGFALMFTNEIILMNLKKGEENCFIIQTRTSWKGACIQRIKYRNSAINYGFAIHSPYTYTARICLDSKSKFTEWRKILEELPVQWKPTTSVISSALISGPSNVPRSNSFTRELVNSNVPGPSS